jgi:hypothetical protein
MSCGRSAISALFACMLFAAPTRGKESTDTAVERIQPSNSEHRELSISCSHCSQLARGASLSRFTPWRNRLKIVLKETDPKINELSSFESAILPDRFINSAVVERVSCRPATRSPLRC